MKFCTLAPVVFSIFTSWHQIKADPINEGRNIFVLKCMNCHRIDKDSTGPALANLEQRHSIDWIIKFVRSPSGIIKSGDSSATALFSKFNRTVMPDHTELSDMDIRNIVSYIQYQTSQTGSLDVIPMENNQTLHTAKKSGSFQHTGLIISFIIVISTLILVLFFANHVKRLERKMHGKE
jgi:mono/diheme cytochrome c family protein